MLTKIVREARFLTRALSPLEYGIYDNLESCGVHTPYVQLIYYSFTWYTKARYRVYEKGAENLPPPGCIVVANHQRYTDIGIIASFLRKRYKMYPYWLAKLSLPFILYRAGSIPIPRAVDFRNFEKYDSFVNYCGQVLPNYLNRILAEKQNLVVFPEGRRFTDGCIHELRDGFIKTIMPNIPDDTLFVPVGIRYEKINAYISIGKPITKVEFMDRGMVKSRLSELSGLPVFRSAQSWYSAVTLQH
jgi:hypothetical protein